MRKVLHLFIFVLFFSAATTVFSQSNYATLSGTVFDPQQKARARMHGKTNLRQHPRIAPVRYQ